MIGCHVVPSRAAQGSRPGDLWTAATLDFKYVFSPNARECITLVRDIVQCRRTDQQQCSISGSRPGLLITHTICLRFRLFASRLGLGGFCFDLVSTSVYRNSSCLVFQCTAVSRSVTSSLTVAAVSHYSLFMHNKLQYT
jgi:hypothetical protein